MGNPFIVVGRDVAKILELLQRQSVQHSRRSRFPRGNGFPPFSRPASFFWRAHRERCCPISIQSTTCPRCRTRRKNSGAWKKSWREPWLSSAEGSPPQLAIAQRRDKKGRRFPHFRSTTPAWLPTRWCQIRRGPRFRTAEIRRRKRTGHAHLL